MWGNSRAYTNLVTHFTLLLIHSTSQRGFGVLGCWGFGVGGWGLGVGGLGLGFEVRGLEFEITSQ